MTPHPALRATLSHKGERGLSGSVNWLKCEWIPPPLMGGGEGEGEMISVNLAPVVKSLRRNSTDAEQRLWEHLRARQIAGMKFRRQEQIGHFIVDFVCYEMRLVIEADGGQHAIEHDKDNERTAWLQSQGFTVLRFWNHEILSSTASVLEIIHGHCLNFPSPRPSPTEGRGEARTLLNGLQYEWIPPPLMGGGEGEGEM